MLLDSGSKDTFLLQYINTILIPLKGIAAFNQGINLAACRIVRPGMHL